MNLNYKDGDDNLTERSSNFWDLKFPILLVPKTKDVLLDISCKS